MVLFSFFPFYSCVLCGASWSKALVVQKFHAAFRDDTAVFFFSFNLLIWCSFSSPWGNRYRLSHRCLIEGVALPRRTECSAGKRAASYGGNVCSSCERRGQRPLQKQPRSTISRQSPPLRECSHDCVGLPVFFFFSLSLSLSLCWLSCFFFLFVAPHWARRDDIGHPSSRDNTYSPD